jgi:hypothetical protein
VERSASAIRSIDPSKYEKLRIIPKKRLKIEGTVAKKQSKPFQNSRRTPRQIDGASFFLCGDQQIQLDAVRSDQFQQL